MRRVLDWLFGIVGTLLLLVGILCIINSIADSDKDSMAELLFGMGSIVFGLILWGLSYIVEAAFIYLEKNEKKQ